MHLLFQNFEVFHNILFIYYLCMPRHASSENNSTLARNLSTIITSRKI